jgi:hypothetical protein
MPFELDQTIAYLRDYAFKKIWYENVDVENLHWAITKRQNATYTRYRWTPFVDAEHKQQLDIVGIFTISKIGRIFPYGFKAVCANARDWRDNAYRFLCLGRPITEDSFDPSDEPSPRKAFKLDRYYVGFMNLCKSIGKIGFAGLIENVGDKSSEVASMRKLLTRLKKQDPSTDELVNEMLLKCNWPWKWSSARKKDEDGKWVKDPSTEDTSAPVIFIKSDVTYKIEDPESFASTFAERHGSGGPSAVQDDFITRAAEQQRILRDLPVYISRRNPQTGKMQTTKVPRDQRERYMEHGCTVAILFRVDIIIDPGHGYTGSVSLDPRKLYLVARPQYAHPVLSGAAMGDLTETEDKVPEGMADQWDDIPEPSADGKSTTEPLADQMAQRRQLRGDEEEEDEHGRDASKHDWSMQPTAMDHKQKKAASVSDAFASPPATKVRKRSPSKSLSSFAAGHARLKKKVREASDEEEEEEEDNEDDGAKVFESYP